MLFQSSVVILSLAVLVGTLAGCGQSGNIGLEAQPNQAQGVIEDDYKDEEDDTAEVETQERIKTCELLMAQNSISVKSQMIRFEDTKVESGRNQVCEFDSGDNLSIKNQYLRARYTQNSLIDLPSNAVICDIEIESGEQNFNYDDIFFLTYNQSILASNHKSEIKKVIQPEFFNHSKINQNIELYTYDWLKLRDTRFENVANDFCLGEEFNLSQCQWPVTQAFGKVKLKFDPEILIRLSQKQNSEKQQLSFIITGDNDKDLDCYHQRLDLNLGVKYYIK